MYKVPQAHSLLHHQAVGSKTSKTLKSLIVSPQGQIYTLNLSLRQLQGYYSPYKS